MPVNENHLRRLVIVIGMASCALGATVKPRVAVTTDIDNGPDDLDDRQSLCHLLFYANELDIRAVIRHRFSRTATEACTLAFDHYAKAFANPKTRCRALGYPGPEKNTVKYAPDGVNFQMMRILQVPPVAPRKTFSELA
jgi:hypothetical protein